MADDYLARLDPPAVAAFYGRLADGVDARKGKLEVSLAALLMGLDPAASARSESPFRLSTPMRGMSTIGTTVAGAVAPKSQTIVVYYKHAKRIEDADLAAPYKFKTKPWLDGGGFAAAVGGYRPQSPDLTCIPDSG